MIKVQMSHSYFTVLGNSHTQLARSTGQEGLTVLSSPSTAQD